MKAYSLAIAQSAENNEPESPVLYDTTPHYSTTDANGETTQTEESYDVKKQEEENSLNGILAQFSKTKDS